MCPDWTSAEEAVRGGVIKVLCSIVYSSCNQLVLRVVRLSVPLDVPGFADRKSSAVLLPRMGWTGLSPWVMGFFMSNSRAR